MVAEPDPTLPATPTPRLDRGRLDRAFAVLEGQVERGELPAAVLAVAGPRGPFEVRAYGSDAGRSVGTDDRFLIASVAKPIVAVTVLQLVAEGAVTLAEPIRAAGARVRPAARRGWTGGCRDRERLAPADPYLGRRRWGLERVIGQRATASDIIRMVFERPLAFVPGTAYHYTSDSFFLLAELVRRVDGTAGYAASLEARLLGPLGMTATGFRPDLPDHRSVHSEVANVDDATAGRWAAWFFALQHPGGGLWSTAGDLVRFGRATLLGGTLDGVRVLGRPFVELMGREHTAGLLEAGDPPRRPSYGLGWAVGWADGRMPGSPGQVGHLGATGSRLWVDPSVGLVIALLANRWGSEQRLSDAVVAAVYGALEDRAPGSRP